jgi:hypothetical protein
MMIESHSIVTISSYIKNEVHTNCNCNSNWNLNIHDFIRIIQDSSCNQNLSINFSLKSSRQSATYFIDNTLSYINRVCFGNDHQIIYSHKNRIQKHMQWLLSFVNYKNIPLIIKYQLDLNNFCTIIYFMLYNLLIE